MFKRKRTFAKKKRRYGKRRKYTFSPYKRIYRSIRAVSRKVAGEVFKFESTPDMYSYFDVDVDGSNVVSLTKKTSLTSIISGEPWIMPINWIYTANGAKTSNQLFINGILYPYPIDPNSAFPNECSLRNPIWRNTEQGIEEFQDSGAQLQYRLKYIYINALFNASVDQSTNTDGAMRIVIICDKQPTGGTPSWSDEDFVTNSRGVFNADRINAQLNPNSVGRFTIMYDKTLRFNTINGYKPFKYFKRLSTIVRNNRGLVNLDNTPTAVTVSRYQTNDQSAPVQKNAYYIMLFPDGVNFTYSTASSTPAASFNLFNRVAYYNN